MSGDPPDLTGVVAALDAVRAAGEGILEPHHLDEVAALRRRIDERLAAGDAFTVVAVAGGTGVGKSALVNRLVGEPVATEGLRRPTTDHPVAVAGHLDDAARTLLDHLDIQDRRVVGEALPDGLVLVDLPDHDSVALDHHRTAQRLTRRVDALVVVVDPIKYARADLHEGPLAELTRHAEVVTVALNRTDEVDHAAVEVLRDDLLDRLAADGLGEVELVVTSAATGAGTQRLRERLEQLAAERTAAVARLVADAAQLADRLLLTIDEPPTAPHDVDAMVGPLLEAVDAGRAAAEAATAYRRDARRGCRSPLAKVVGFLPERLAAEARATVASTRPHTRSVDRSEVAIEAALARQLHLADAVGHGHASMARTIERVAHDAAPAVLDAVDAVPAAPRPRRWWPALAWLRGLAETTAAVGAVWLLLIGFAGWLGLPEVPRPALTDQLSWPAGLLLLGSLVRLLLGALSRLAIAAGARRHAAAIGTELRRRLVFAFEERVIEPVKADVERRRSVRRNLDVLAAG